MGVLSNEVPRRNRSVVESALPAGGMSFPLYGSGTGGLATTKFKGTAEFSFTTAHCLLSACRLLQQWSQG